MLGDAAAGVAGLCALATEACFAALCKPDAAAASASPPSASQPQSRPSTSQSPSPPQPPAPSSSPPPLSSSPSAAAATTATHASSLRVCVSMYEIYREAVYDLLAPAGKISSKISVLEDASGAVQLVGLTEHAADSPAVVLRLLQRAQAARRTGNNSLNERSSRSHAALQLVLR
eukprot:6189708-Pleurochrysis_carterae.AAC.1